MDTILSMFYLIFLPFEWADLGLAINDFIDVASSLYAKCQMQNLIAQFAFLMTFEGIGGISSRIALGAQAELPFYLTKMSATKQNCIRGEMMGKVA